MNEQLLKGGCHCHGLTIRARRPRNRQVPLFTSGGLGLGNVILVLVLVLRIWSCLHHWLTSLYSTPVAAAVVYLCERRRVGQLRLFN